MDNFSKLSINIDEQVRFLFEERQRLEKLEQYIKDSHSSGHMGTRSRSNSIRDATESGYSSSNDTEPDEKECSFVDDHYDEITEMVHELMDDYMNMNVLQMKEPNFHENMVKELGDHIYNYFNSIELDVEDISIITEEIIEHIPTLYECFVSSVSIPPRSSTTDCVLDLTSEDSSLEYLKNQLALLECSEQHEQRSSEWYAFRHNLISASNLWKVFGTPAQQNSLICEKCKPLECNAEQPIFVNINSPLHWGVKYEPVTVMIYELLYKTKVGEFGCIQHPQYSFMGASPDGINIDTSSDKYGRMLEIKNIYNRDITGIPKQEYWVQTQIQMECCNLPLCDFVETRIKEYDNSADFYSDLHNPIYKGVVLHFSHENMQNLVPKYVYMPLDSETDEPSVNEWIYTQKQLQLDQDHVLVNTLYWYLDEYSCVIIQRNRKWFNAALPEIEAIWNTIEKERVEGFEHRRSKKRTPSLVIETATDGDVKILEAISDNQCLDVHKLDS